MKFSAALLALASLTLAVPALHADSISATLKTGTGVDVLTPLPLVNGEQFTYVHETLGTFSNGNFLNSSTSTVTATYVDALGTLGVLNVTDACVDVTVFGPAVSCQPFAFSFTDLTLGNASVVLAVNAFASVAGDVANLNFAGSVGEASGTFDFGPGGGGGNSPVPEPGTLSLMATGLLSAAGLVRKRFMA